MVEGVLCFARRLSSAYSLSRCSGIEGIFFGWGEEKKRKRMRSARPLSTILARQIRRWLMTSAISSSNTC